MKNRFPKTIEADEITNLSTYTYIKLKALRFLKV